MNYFKIFLLVLAAAAFALSCGQSPQSPNTRSAAPNSAWTNTGSNSTGASNSDTYPPAQKRLQSDATNNVLEVSPDLYEKNCMICHKDTGKGGKVTIEGKTLNPSDLTSARMKARTDEKLLEGIKEGVPDEGMPAFKTKLADEQIKSIVQYIRNLK
jgi:mono/diheme cytochrome c family protein